MMLRLLGRHWKEHLLALDHLRQGINLRSYAQSNPVNEYKREAFNMFKSMLDQVRADFVQSMLHFRLDRPDEGMDELVHALLPRVSFEKMAELTPDWANQPVIKNESRLGLRAELTPEFTDSGQGLAAPRSTRQKVDVDPADPSTWGRVMRNDPCPCGSDKKYKHCHGAINAQG